MSPPTTRSQATSAPRRVKQPDNPPDDEFDLGLALDELRARATEIEATAHAADSELDSLPHVAEPAAALAVRRLFRLVEVTARTAEALIQECDALIARSSQR